MRVRACMFVRCVCVFMRVSGRVSVSGLCSNGFASASACPNAGFYLFRGGFNYLLTYFK